MLNIEALGRDMIRKLFFATAALAVVSAAPAAAATRRAAATASAALPASNPFARPSTLPLQTPDFSRIKEQRLFASAARRNGATKDAKC